MTTDNRQQLINKVNTVSAFVITINNILNNVVNDETHCKYANHITYTDEISDGYNEISNPKITR